MFPIPYTKQRWWFGTGIISTVGISSSFLPIFNTMFAQLKVDNPNTTWNEAWGTWMGTVAVCALFPTLVSFLNPKILTRLFPPYTVGTVIILIGTSILGTGMKNWGGGSTCYTTAAIGISSKLPYCMVPAQNGTLVPGTCYGPPVSQKCKIGELSIQFGDPRMLGLGATVFLFLILIELFGSPFMRNSEIMLALIFGFLASAFVTIDGQKMVTPALLRKGEIFTLPLFKTFPLGIFPGAIIPVCVGQIVGIMECIGDVSATEEGSRVPTTGVDHNRRVQGGLLGSGLSQIVAPLLTGPPAIVYASNSGIVALSRCASWRAGAMAGGILMIIGVFGRIGSFFAAIPTPILGATTTFTNGIIITQGIRICHEARMTRKERFVMAAVIAVGAGIDLAPNTWQTNFWKLTPGMSPFTKAMRDTVLIIMSSGLAFGSVATIVLNLLLPEDNLVYDVLEESRSGDTALALKGRGPKTASAFKVEAEDPIEDFKVTGQDASPNSSNDDKTGQLKMEVDV